MRSELWQHKASGEMVVVDVADNGIIIAASEWLTAADREIAHQDVRQIETWITLADGIDRTEYRWVTDNEQQKEGER